MTESPRVLIVVHVPEFHDAKEDAEWEADVSMVDSTVREAGVNSSFAFGLSDLEVLTKRHEYDLAVVDLACPGVDDFVTRLIAETPRPLKLASMRFWTSVSDPRQRSWAIRHFDYSRAEQLGAEIRAMTGA